MKKWTNTNPMRRLLSLTLSMAMVLSVLPAGALAEEGENTPPSCTCEVACAETVNESCQVCSTEVGQCTAAQQQEPVQQESEQEQKTETCTHGNDPETCEACASAKKVAQVQAQIDALPGDVTAESKEAAQSALSAVDEAKSALTESEQTQLDMTQYTALTQKLAALESPAPSATEKTTEKTDKVISAWAWIDEEEYLDEETDGLALPGASEEMPAYFVDVVTFLPYEITATVDGVEETLTIDWVCDNYPEDGAYEGEYTFTATLPEGYALDEGVKALTVPVLLGGIKRYATGISYMTWDGSQKKLVSATCDSATEVTGSADDVTWRTGWYVVNQDVTFGSMMKPVAVRAEGDIHLILADGVTCTIYGRLEVNSSDEESDSLTIYGQSGQSGRLDVQNVSHYSCATDGEADGCSDPTNKTNMYLAYSAAIGSKCKAPETGEYASYDTKITINGGNVTASFVAYNHKTDVTGTPSLCWAAAIGSGPFANATITINGGTVNGNDPDIGAGIGAGYYSEGTVVINGGTVEGHSNGGAGIGGGGGSSKKTATITINGGKVTGTSETGAGIGSAGCGDNQGGSYTKIYINGGEVTGGSSRGAGIGSGYRSNTSSIEIKDGTVTGDGGEGAGIGSGASAYKASIKITGGIVKAKAGKGAAIGSGNEANDNQGLTTINITGGDISASTEHHNQSGAAIGGSYSGSKVSKIEIRNAKVVARAVKGSPGIGDGSVTISNSTVEAYGGQYAAGIGSRQQTNSNTITIENSNVTAVGGNNGAAGIGTGNFYSFSNSAMGKITITDSTVNAKGTAGAAGIGGGARVQVDGSNIEISGGTVYARRGRGPIDSESQLYQAFDIGDGEIPADQQGVRNTYCKFTLPANGTAWVYLESNNTRKDINQISGVVLEKKQPDGGYETCTVYGTQSLSADYPIASGRSMTVTSDATLNTSNYGIYVQNGGTLKRDGTVNGNVYYPLTLTDCTATNTTTYQSSLFGKEGAFISLTPDLPAGYKFDSWTVTPSTSVSGNRFTMPQQATTVKANISLAVNITQQPVDKEITYGENVTLSIDAVNPSNTTDGISYQWYKGAEKLTGETASTLTLTKPNAGTYVYFCRVTWDGISIDSSSATVTVNKAQASVTINSAPSKTYDGQPAVLTNAMYTTTGDGAVTVEYTKQGETNYSTDAPTDAGDYTVLVTLHAGTNFTEASDTENFTISKATDNAWLTAPTVTNFTYGDTVNPVTYKAKYGNDKVKITYKKKGTKGDSSPTVPTDAGTYDVTVSLAETNNYGPKLEATNLTLTIAKAASSVTTAPTDAQSLYTGSPVLLVNAGTADGGTMKYRLGEDGEWTDTIPTATDWKNYTVYYKVVGDNNHNDTEAKSLTAEIVPFKVLATQAAVEITYGQDAALSVNPNTNLPDEISYQWYQVTGSEGDVELSGETANKLTIDKPNAGTYSYICKITCGDYFKYSDPITVTVNPAQVENVNLSGYWAEGGEWEIAQDETISLTNPSSRLLTKYTTTTNDQGGEYPTGMQVFELNESNNPEEIPALENLLQYSGCSIRINGKPGIRMITSLTKEAKEALKKGELAGYTLEEYGTVAQWSKNLGGQPLTLSTGNSNYAYKKGVSDPVFANVGNLTQYTNVLVWDSLPDEKLAQDILMRPYIILSNEDGETVTLYGGIVSRSIGYVAQQNADTFPVGSAGYKYVHDIIDKVANLNQSNESTTTAGG
ncbi:MAG: hypothetical protein MSH58_07325 [Clostridiales bacterium]|nr:hypothetical protein [Clostridiales bacterium]